MKGSKSKLKYFYLKFIDLPSSQGTSSSTHTDDGIHTLTDGNNLKSQQDLDTKRTEGNALPQLHIT